LQVRCDIPRPTVPVPASMVPTTTKHVAIDKRRAAQLGITLIPGMLQPGVGPEKWWTRKRIRFDGVRTMLHLWGSSQAATKHRYNKQEKGTLVMEQWRQGWKGASLSTKENEGGLRDKPRFRSSRKPFRQNFVVN
jgi:hypothetical protein